MVIQCHMHKYTLYTAIGIGKALVFNIVGEKLQSFTVQLVCMKLVPLTSFLSFLRDDDSSKAVDLCNKGLE